MRQAIDELEKTDSESMITDLENGINEVEEREK